MPKAFFSVGALVTQLVSMAWALSQFRVQSPDEIAAISVRTRYCHLWFCDSSPRGGCLAG